MDEKVIKKSELVIEVLDYAHEHNLDINDKATVKKILEHLDPKQDIEEFMMLLQNADTFLEMTDSKKESKKPNLPN